MTLEERERQVLADIAAIKLENRDAELERLLLSEKPGDQQYYHHLAEVDGMSEKACMTDERNQ